MNELQRDAIFTSFGLVFTLLPYAAALYHNELLCQKNPVACVVYEQKYTSEQPTFDLNDALEQGLTRLETLVQIYREF